MTGFIVRDPRPDEAEVLADLHLQTWRETYEGLLPDSQWNDDARADRLRMWGSICTNPGEGRRFGVAEIDGEVVAIAGAGTSQDDPAPREHQLWFLYALASAHGSGVGQALLDRVIGDEPASLWVLEQNPRAEAFYVRNGFRRDGATRPSFEGSPDEIRMVR